MGAVVMGAVVMGAVVMDLHEGRSVPGQPSGSGNGSS